MASRCKAVEGGSATVIQGFKPPTGPEKTVEPPAAPKVRPKPPTTVVVPSPPARNAEPTIASTGTGFFVSPLGHLITNAHVVSGCKRLVARRATSELFPLAVVAVDERNDLALLKSNITDNTAFFRRGPAPLGEGVIVYGFPLVGTLAVSGNLTTGSISAVAGLGDDASKYQVSAPVQQGNSGGAVLDESGLVVGVVQSKLNAVRATQLTGDIPQNINFAIKAGVVKNFLKTQGIRYVEKDQVPARKVSAIADDAIGYTVLIACYQ